MENITKEKILSLWKQNIDKPHYNTMYIDIPFCTQYCDYCIYKKNYRYTKDNLKSYLDFLYKEMQFFSAAFKNKKISALHVGGGSPSLLSPYQIEWLSNSIMHLYNIDENENGARTIEFNPFDINNDKIKAAFEYSIFNRVTFGIQSFSEEVLLSENRIYTSPDKFKKIVYELRKVDPNININVDLMMGLKNETKKTIIDSFDILNDLKINRITFYINNNIPRTIEFVNFVRDIISHLNETYSNTYLLKSIDATEGVGVERCHLFFNKKKEHSYDYLYSLGPLMANQIAFGPLSISHIKETLYVYERDLQLDFNKSQYKGGLLNITPDEEILNFAFVKENNKFRF